MKETMNINNYINKMRRIEEIQLTKDMQAEDKKSSFKNLPKFSMASRAQQEEKLMKTRSCLFEKRMQNYEKNWQLLQTTRKNQMLERGEREREAEELARRKCEARDKLEHQRLMASNKRRKAPLRTDSPQVQNIAAYLHKYSRPYHSIGNQAEERERENHNLAMKRVYGIIEKMKKCHGRKPLTRSEVGVLLEYLMGYCRNLDPKESEGDYNQICDFVNLPRDKFL
jgi:hypothetical protein